MSNRTVTQLGAIVLMASSIVPLSAKTQTVKGNTYADTAEVGVRTLMLIGAGLRERWWLDVYTMGAYAENRTCDPQMLISMDGAKSLRIDLLRDGDAKNMADALEDALDKNCRRGDLTVWFDEEAIANWKADKTGKPGGQRVYSDMAIETGLVVRMVYKLAYRQTEGFLHSIASLLGLGIEIPDYSTLCRRSRLLRKKLRIPKAASTQPIHLMIDSTGLRIHVGTARKPPKLRAWRKLHIAVDRETGNIVASELTASRARDATRVPALLTQIQAPLVSVAADSAYDKEAVYEAIEAHSPGRRTRVVIPPQRNATLSQNSNTAMQERDRHIRAIERHGRREWYKLSGYTKRSMVENAVYRYKAIIGPEMRARTLARQRVEHRIGCEILNKMAALGMPDTYCAG